MAVRLIAVFMLGTVLPAHALAQSYPQRPVRVILPQQPGSSVDTITRIVAAKLSELLDQQFVVDNRPGAGGMLGAQMAARAAPDGHTLLSGAASSMIITQFTYRSPGFDPIADFAPISFMVSAEAVLAVGNNVAAKSVKEFIALAKERPGQLRMASAGVGSSSHLAEVKQQYAHHALVPLGSPTPEAFGEFFRADVERVIKLVKLAGLKPE